MHVPRQCIRRVARNLTRGVSIVGFAAGAVACSPRAEMHPPREAILATHADAAGSAGPASTATPEGTQPGQVGVASWYGRAFAGKKTTSGERFDPKLYTAAHRTLPFGTWVEVRRLDTGGVVRVRINDRGPNGKARDRVIDLSQRAAEDLGLVRDGLARVELRVVDGP